MEDNRNQEVKKNESAPGKRSEQFESIPVRDRLASFTSRRLMESMSALIDAGITANEVTERLWVDDIRGVIPELRAHGASVDVIVTGERHLINAQIREISGGQQLAANIFNPDKTKAPRSRAGSSVRSVDDSLVHGSSNVRLAGVPGLEPRTTEPESAVLPITPYPNGFDRSRTDHPL